MSRSDKIQGLDSVDDNAGDGRRSVGPDDVKDGGGCGVHAATEGDRRAIESRRSSGLLMVRVCEDMASIVSTRS